MVTHHNPFRSYMIKVFNSTSTHCDFIAGVTELSRRFVWIGTDTFPASPATDLHQVSLGAIRVEPYSEDTQLLDKFKVWVNKLTRSDLPKHTWTDQ